MKAMQCHKSQMCSSPSPTIYQLGVLGPNHFVPLCASVSHLQDEGEAIVIRVLANRRAVLVNIITQSSRLLPESIHHTVRLGH